MADGRQIVVGGARQRTVLAMLLLAPDRVVSIDRLIDAVWNGQPPATSRTQIAICVASLRRSLQSAGCPDDIIVTAAPGYRLAAGMHRIDSVDFAYSVDAAQKLIHQGRVAEAAERLREALDLWRGTALSDVSSSVLETEAGMLERQRLAAYEQYATLQLQLGKHHEIVSELSTLVEEQPLWEHARASLMLAHYRSGRRHEALKLYHDARRMFATELGLEPSRVLQELHVAILRESPKLLPTAGQGGSPYDRAAETTLPPDVLTFVGRQRQLAALDRLLDSRRPDDSPATALVTGRAGVGKTALAVHWARRVADLFPDGRMFVDFQGRAEAQASIGAVCAGFLQALGVPEEEAPADIEARVVLYQRLVANRRCLFVLKGVSDPAWIQPLIPRSRNSCVLIVSRRVLADNVQVRIRLDPLSADEAVRLLEAADDEGRTPRGDEAVGQLAELCDHLPLALTAAAERLAAKPHWKVSHLLTRLLDPQQRLNELSHGQHSVRTALDRGYRELDLASAAMYRALGLVDSAEIGIRMGQALMGVDAIQAETIMEKLVDASILRVVGRDSQGGFSYWLPGLTRLHAREQAELEDSPADREAARRRLARILTAVDA
ncbi:MAG TPA: BTAD domain-containing putative transcriptional regulator [Pilimelia sp.]|nr:BTAD domain-containing putative transcriptional regulator [Pilimelia sp.]